MTNRQVNTFTAGLMVIALLSLIVLTLCSGCDNRHCIPKNEVRATPLIPWCDEEAEAAP